MSRPDVINEPTAISCGISIAVPIHPLFTIKVSEAKHDIYQCEKYIIEARDKEENPDKKKALDRCRAVLQWASACGASLAQTDTPSVYNTIDFYFVFDNLDIMLRFNEELKTRIESFMIF